jgi:hypothetical protein
MAYWDTLGTGSVGDWENQRFAEAQAYSAPDVAAQQFENQKWLEKMAEANKARQAQGNWGWMKGLGGLVQAAAPLAGNIYGWLDKKKKAKAPTVVGEYGGGFGPEAPYGYEQGAALAGPWTGGY